MTYKEGDRVLCERYGARFAGTVDSDEFVVSDIDGQRYLPDAIIEKLTGLRAAKAGDIIESDLLEGESKIIAITNNHEALLISFRGAYSKAADWFTFEEAEKRGWNLKDSAPLGLTISEISKILGYPVKVVEPKE